MICKWCGETVKPGIRTCRRCKRELPALSDCGGFYDLVTDAPSISARIPETAPIAETPVRPVLPERKKSGYWIHLVAVIAGALALILLIVTISLSGKLADARQEADRLRHQNKSKEDTAVTDPSAPDINGLGEKDPEPTDEPKDISLILVDGAGETQLNAAQNTLLNTGILRFTLCREGENDALLQFTLQRRSGEAGEEIFLQITSSNGIEIYSIEWHNDDLVELPEDEEQGSIFDIFTSPEAITEFSKPIDELGEGTSVCTLSGKDENGEDLTITIYGIVIE